MKVSEQYSYEIKKILNDIDQLKHGKIHELRNQKDRSEQW